MTQVRVNRSGKCIDVHIGDLVVSKDKNMVGEITSTSWSIEVRWSDGTYRYYSTWNGYKSIDFVVESRT